MAVNAKIQDYETMINGLQKYMSSLEEHSKNLKEAVKLYDDGVNDRSSNVYRKKIDKLCSQIDPVMIEKVDNLKKNLEAQREQLLIMLHHLEQEENECE